MSTTGGSGSGSGWGAVSCAAAGWALWVFVNASSSRSLNSESDPSDFATLVLSGGECRKAGFAISISSAAVGGCWSQSSTATAVGVCAAVPGAETCSGAGALTASVDMVAACQLHAASHAASVDGIRWLLCVRSVRQGRCVCVGLRRSVGGDGLSRERTCTGRGRDVENARFEDFGKGRSGALVGTGRVLEQPSPAQLRAGPRCSCGGARLAG